MAVVRTSLASSKVVLSLAISLHKVIYFSNQVYPADAIVSRIILWTGDILLLFSC